MIHSIKIIIKKFTPECVFKAYYYWFGFFGALWYGFPSRKLFVVGITGTTGKTSVAYMLSRIFEEAGQSVGMISTAIIKVGKNEWYNQKKMTMLGRMQTQKLLRKMVKNKCHIAIVETTSEGIKQFRHRWINYDVALITNLSPEHIESHGSFENYREAKGKLFFHLARCSKKHIPFLKGKTFLKTRILNMDDPHVEFFLQSSIPRTFGFGFKKENKCNFIANECHNVVASNIKISSVSLKESSLRFQIENIDFLLPLFGGLHHIENALAAITVSLAAGLDMNTAAKALKKIDCIPGRLERILETNFFDIIVDYAFEPRAMEALYQSINLLQERPKHIIHVAGGTGGGRDRARRAIIGEFIGNHADIFIITDEDPYDEDPKKIMEDVGSGAKKTSMKEGENLFFIEDRRMAIRYALTLMREGDLLLVTGKGCEQAMVKKGKLLPWDDRKVVREELEMITRND